MKFITKRKERKAVKKFLLKKNSLVRQRKFTNLNNAKTIGLIYDGADMKKTEMIRKLIKRLVLIKKSVRTIAYIDDPTVLDRQLRYSDIIFFCKNDVKTDGKPSKFQISAFMDIQFDILIDLTIQNFLASKYVVALSKAKLKVGKYVKEKDYLDMMIKTDNFELLINQILNYLQSIK